MASKQREVVEFNYDISCPFAYIASTRIEALAARTSSTVIWTPVLLGGIYRATSAPQGAAGSASDVFNPAKKAITSAAFTRTISRYAIPFHQPRKHPQKTVAALRLLYALGQEERVRLSKALFRAYWVEDQDVSDGEVVREVARRCGVHDEVGADDVEMVDGALRRATADAVERGASGVPAFWIQRESWRDPKGEARHGRLYWGQDRMHFVEAVLLTLSTGCEYQDVPELRGLQPRCVWTPKKRGQKKVKVEFWYDFSSPWAFLGWTQVKRLKREGGEDLEIEMKPFLLGALFRDIGSPMMPVLALSAQKRTYMGWDQADWVRHWNALNVQEGSPDKPIQLRFPDQFPIRSPMLLRVAMVEPATIPALYAASWSLNIDVSDPVTLAAHLQASGFDDDDLLRRAAEPQYKEQLRENTAEALNLGLCGAPSYRVLEKNGADWETVGCVIWGQDELGTVLDLVAGWREGDGRKAQVEAEAGVSGSGRAML